MLNTKENFNQLDATLSVKELDNEAAATIQGGWDLEVYRHIDFIDRVGSFNVRSPQVKANDQISSFIINAGTWRFYEDANYKGAFFDIGPGSWNLTASWNDRISSLKKL